MKKSSLLKLLTHNKNKTSANYAKWESRLRKKKNLVLPLDIEIQLLRQLCEFELGQFLLENQGLNGYWTAYLIIHAMQKNNLHPLENWLIHKAPTAIATRERFKIFHSVLQRSLKNEIKIASIPCGTMDDLLKLDYTPFNDIQLFGIDLDITALELARQNALLHKNTKVEFIFKDAWQLGIQSEFDIIRSSGLNIYESSYARLVHLFREFYRALKPGGILINSFMTSPPSLSQKSTWKNFDIEDVLIQRALFTDIIEVKWECFRTEREARKQLKEAGFKVLEVIYDHQGIYPTILAQK